MKPSKLKDHFRKLHPNEADKDIGNFKDLHDKHANKRSLVDMFSAAAHENGLPTSYNIALLITKVGKAHAIGETLNKKHLKPVLITVNIELRKPTD